MTEEIENIRLAFECPADYKAMQDVNGGKFCTVCQKTVHDFTNSKADIFRQIMAENNGNICGRFIPSQMTTYSIRPVWKRWISAALILIGFNLIDRDVFAQGAVLSRTQKNNQKKAVIHELQEARGQSSTDTIEDKAVFGGVMEYQPEFPGGLKELNAFLSSNLKYISSASGKKVFATFVIREDGSLSDPKILRGINTEADAEVLRVLKLSPQWKPGMQKAKPVRIQYSVPVYFK